MTFPAFFSQVPTLLVRDRLAELLGAAAQGMIEYGYADAVKLAGHSCPTVAGAYLLTCRALQALYPGEIPQRGEIRVDFRELQEDGVSGVVAAVIGLLTGAAGGGGFKGLAGRFSRRDLLCFGCELHGEIRFTRQDTARSVTVSLHLGQVPPDARLGPLLQGLLAGECDPRATELFATLWQDRVRRILLDHFTDPEIVSLT